jgi:hypothetical protein
MSQGRERSLAALLLLFCYRLKGNSLQPITIPGFFKLFLETAKIGGILRKSKK